MKFAALACLASLFMLPMIAQPATAQIVIADSSFEEPNIGDGSEQNNPPVAGASFVNYAGVTGNNALFYQFPLAPDGDQVGTISGHTSSVTLAVSGLVPGSTYAVRFHIAKGAVYNATPISVSFNGAALGTFSPAAVSFTQVTTATFTPTGSSGSLTFAGSTSTSPMITAIDKILIVAAAPPIVIPDSSFEDPNIGDGSAQNNPSVPGTSFLNHAGVAGNNALFYQFPAAPDGDQVGTIAGSTSSIALTVSGLVPGSTYVARFYMAKGAVYNANPIAVSFSGAALGTFTPAVTSFTPAATATFTPTGSSGTLNFAGSTSTSPMITAIDKISIVATAPQIGVPSASFEEPNIGDGSAMWNPTVAGASFVNYAGVAGNGTGFYQFPAAPDGDQVGVIANSTSSIALTVTGLVPGSNYLVKFSMAKGAVYNATPISVSFNGAALGTFTPSSTSFVQITTASFTPSGASGTLNFAGSTSTSAMITAIDKILIVPDLGTESVAYSYDALGRLVGASTTGSVNSGLQVQTTYDAAGNRTNVSVSGVPQP